MWKKGRLRPSQRRRQRRRLEHASETPNLDQAGCRGRAALSRTANQKTLRRPSGNAASPALAEVPPRAKVRDPRRFNEEHAADLREIIKKLDSAKQQEDRPKAACSCCQEARYQTQRISALGDRR